MIQPYFKMLSKSSSEFRSSYKMSPLFHWFLNDYLICEPEQFRGHSWFLYNQYSLFRNFFPGEEPLLID